MPPDLRTTPFSNKAPNSSPPFLWRFTIPQQIGTSHPFTAHPKPEKFVFNNERSPRVRTDCSVARRKLARVLALTGASEPASYENTGIIGFGALGAFLIRRWSFAFDYIAIMVIFHFISMFFVFRIIPTTYRLSGEVSNNGWPFVYVEDSLFSGASPFESFFIEHYLNVATFLN